MKNSAKVKIKWTRAIYITGIIALIIGVLDPLEGSVVIAFGSALTALAAYLTHNSHLKAYLMAFMLIVAGVFFMFYFSSLGGFGGESNLSWWWTMLILPYPIGWILAIYLICKDR